MNLTQYYKWRDKCKLMEKDYFLLDKNRNNKPERQKKEEKIHSNQCKDRKYQKLIKLAREEWIHSMDGVVKALRYNTKKRNLWPGCTIWRITREKRKK